MAEHDYSGLARRLWDAYNRHDLDAMSALTHPDFVGRSVNPIAEGGEPYRGREGARRWWADLFETFSDVQADLHHALVIGDRMFQMLTITYTTREGMALPTPVWIVTEFDDELVKYVRTFLDPAEAFEHMAERLRS
ncbi:MAG: nuclear transport factor 2 family protein [Thermoleophilaceae bacterium]